VSVVLAGALPALSWVGWLALAAVLVLGLVGEAALARRIDGARAMRLVIAVAVLCCPSSRASAPSDPFPALAPGSRSRSGQSLTSASTMLWSDGRVGLTAASLFS
jgi:hypothetical protein